MAVQGCPYHDKCLFCYSSLVTLYPAPHLPLAATHSIAWSVYIPVSYLNPNTSPKELQLSSLGYLPSLRDCPTGDTDCYNLLFPSSLLCPPSLTWPCLSDKSSPPHHPHHLIILVTTSPCHLLSTCHLVTAPLASPQCHDTLHLDTLSPYQSIILEFDLILILVLSSTSTSTSTLSLTSTSTSSHPCLVSYLHIPLSIL